MNSGPYNAVPDLFVCLSPGDGEQEMFRIIALQLHCLFDGQAAGTVPRLLNENFRSVLVIAGGNGSCYFILFDWNTMQSVAEAVSFRLVMRLMTFKRIPCPRAECVSVHMRQNNVLELFRLVMLLNERFNGDEDIFFSDVYQGCIRQ